MKKINKTINKKMDLRISLLSAMIYIIHKILIFIKNYLNYLQDNIFELFSKNYNRLLVFWKIIFFIIYNDGKSKVWRRKHA